MKRVLVGGCFDLIHYGHIKFLTEAKKAGDWLIVALESDENVRRHKGSNRPIHPQRERAEMLRSLRMVDEVIELPTLTKHQDYFDLVKKIKPAVIAVTEGDSQLENKKKQAKFVKAEVKVVTLLMKPYSTSLLIKEL